MKNKKRREENTCHKVGEGGQGGGDVVACWRLRGNTNPPVDPVQHIFFPSSSSSRLTVKISLSRDPPRKMKGSPPPLRGHRAGGDGGYMTAATKAFALIH